MQEFRPGRFEILPPVIKNLIIINVLVFIAQSTLGANSSFIEDTFALHTWQSPLFKPWQFVTHLFMHGGFSHIFFNMFALWTFGSVLENLWGPKRFLTFYIICGLGAALCHMIVLYFETNSLLSNYADLSSNFNYETFYNFFIKENIDAYRPGSEKVISLWQENKNNPEIANQVLGFTKNFVQSRVNEPTIGASGAVFGCLAAFGYLFPNTYLYIYFFFPLKAKWFVIIYAGIELFSTLQNSAGDSVAHVAHLGGALFGLALVYFWNKSNRRNFY